MSEIDEDIREKAMTAAFELPWFNVPNQDFDKAVGVIASALQDERDGGWQDIATAPKDGTEIVAHDIKTGTSHVTHFVAQFSWQHNWHDPDSHYYSETPEFEPTHWMPLPRPPHSKDSEG